MKLRRVAISLFIGGGALVLPLASQAAADGPPSSTSLPDAACNEGTAHAQASNPNPFNPHIPHSHPGTACMTMPAMTGPND